MFCLRPLSFLLLLAACPAAAASWNVLGPKNNPLIIMSAGGALLVGGLFAGQGIFLPRLYPWRKIIGDSGRAEALQLAGWLSAALVIFAPMAAGGWAFASAAEPAGREAAISSTGCFWLTSVWMTAACSGMVLSTYNSDTGRLARKDERRKRKPV